MAEISRFVRQSQILLGLSDWVIQVGAGTQEEAYASISIQSNYQRATIHVGHDILNGTALRPWKELILHEMLHLYGAYQCDVLDFLIQQGSKVKVVLGAVEAYREAVTDRAARTVHTLMERIDGTDQARQDAYAGPDAVAEDDGRGLPATGPWTLGPGREDPLPGADAGEEDDAGQPER